MDSAKFAIGTACDFKLGIVRYMRIVAYTAVQGVYVFVFIGVLRTIFDIAVAELQKADGIKKPENARMSPKKGAISKGKDRLPTTIF